MNQNRNLLIGIALVAALCLCSGVAAFLVFREAGTRVTRSFKTDPTSIAQVSARIAQFDVPQGYQPGMAMSLLNYDTVVLSPLGGQTGTMFMLMQVTGGPSMDAEQMRRQLEQQSGQSGSNMKITDSYQTTIRGEKTTVTVEESDGGQGYILRQLFVMFKGNQGPAILMIEGRKDTWDQTAVDKFIASIR